MKLAAPTLGALLEQNVLEIKFTRRRQRQNIPPTRRMLCTNSQQLLLSENGMKVLNYRPASGSSVNKTLHNVVVTWDIMKQDYRCVSADDCELITQLPADDEFWSYFNTTILPMTTAQKEAFMNS